MSHFTVLVISKTNDPDELTRLLAPYDENTAVEPYFEKIEEGRWNHYIDWCVKENKDPTSDFEDYWGRPKAVENGQVGYLSTHNPQSKWDWYQLGGRWIGELISTDPERVVGDTGLFTAAPTNPNACDGSRKRYIDFDAMGAAQVARLKEAYQRDAQARHGQTEHEFVTEHFSPWRTFAVVTSNGEWHQRGEMGWFGASYDEVDNWPEVFARLVGEADDDDWFFVFDLHI